MTLSRYSLLILTIILSSCSFFDRNKDDVGDGLPEAELYNAALDSLSSGQASTAVQYLQALEAQFPFGSYAEQAQLELIYAHFRAYDHEAAMAAANRFIRLHPEHPNVDYAYYMRGLISFTQEASFIGQFLPLDITTRDPGSARESFTFFSELLVRFPNSTYGPDARKRILYLRNLLARHEVNVANYYLKRGAYLASVNRGRYVVENFQGSPAVPDGLAIMAQGYIVLGYDELAENTIKVLAENYPEHPALDENGDFKRRDVLSNGKRSLLNRLSFGWFDKPEPYGYDTRDIYNSEYWDGKGVEAEHLRVEK